MRRAENQPTTELTLYAGIYCKRWTIPDTGTLLPQHSHSYDHLTYLVSGAVRVYRNDQYRGDYYAPSAIRIPARQAHAFQSLEDNVVLLCLHNMDHAEADGEPPLHEDNSLPED